MKNKRESSETNIESIQIKNQEWWTNNTMTYDWNDKVIRTKYSQEWFDEIDKRFVYGSRLFAHDKTPFDRIIPFESLRGKRVLEIGCGMGFHSELLSRAGALLTSIDISPTSIEATKARFALKNLNTETFLMDARVLDFPDSEFDFVWSWGVIHHSAQTGQIIKEINRVLKPGGETRIMVYNIDGMPAYLDVLKYVFGFWRGHLIDDYLWKGTDGFMARHYSKDMLTDILGIFFSSINIETYGQDADAIPLPRYLRNPIVRFISNEKLAKAANKHGPFLFARAIKPL